MQPYRVFVTASGIHHSAHARTASRAGTTAERRLAPNHAEQDLGSASAVGAVDLALEPARTAHAACATPCPCRCDHRSTSSQRGPAYRSPSGPIAWLERSTCSNESAWRAPPRLFAHIAC